MIDCRRAGLFFGILIAFLPRVGLAQFGPTPGTPCPTCGPNICRTCATTTMRPVVNTTYRPQFYTTYRDVPQVEYRREARQQQIPVTVHRTVTKDEGGYQRVWVPKIVSRQVPETVYQQRTTWKTVPYQTTRRVAEVRSRNLPQRTVQYVPHVTHTTAFYPTPGYPPARTAAAPYLPPRPVPEPQFAVKPVPDPRFLETPAVDDGDWNSVTVRKRDAETANRTPGLATDTSTRLPKPTRTSSRPSRPTPTAAAVWRSHYR